MQQLCKTVAKRTSGHDKQNDGNMDREPLFGKLSQFVTIAS